MSRKEKIPSAVRNTVWLRWVSDKNNAKCYCCKLETITTANWHCGHVISEKNGGAVHLNNLRPICAGCNCSMGKTDMFDFMHKYGFDTIGENNPPINKPLLKKKESKKKKRRSRAPSGFVKPTLISIELAAFLKKEVGTEIARTEVTREINAYIRAHNLQDPKNGRVIRADSKLRKLLKLNKEDELTYFNLQRYMSPHFAKATKKTPVATSS